MRASVIITPLARMKRVAPIGIATSLRQIVASAFAESATEGINQADETNKPAFAYSPTVNSYRDSFFISCR